MVLGRKDGVVAEFRNSVGGNWSAIDHYYQNSGRLPALSVCISNDAFGAHQGSELYRLRAKSGIGKFSVSGSACPTVPGESVFPINVVPAISRQKVEALRSIKGQPLIVNSTVQYCTSFGRYVCSQFSLIYIPEYDEFRSLLYNDCSSRYGKAPPFPGDLPDKLKQSTFDFEVMPPCDKPGDQEERQRQLEEWKSRNP